MATETVFVSYSRRDQDFVDRLVADLRGHGAKIWLDRESIYAGDNWQEAIESGLAQASTLLYILTPDSLKSAWMSSEVGAAFGQGKRVVPVLAKDVSTEEVPPFLAQFQWVDFRESYDAGLKRLLHGLSLAPIAPEAKRPQKAAKTTRKAAAKRAAKSPAAPKRKTKGYAFLSYAEPDRDFVQPLKTFLRNHGYSYWDYEESDRDYHSQLFLELEGVIREASATLCVLSESWKRSQWTVKEFFFSTEVGTPVFLLKAKELGPTLAIAGLTYIDFTRDETAAFAKLERELLRKRL